MWDSQFAWLERTTGRAAIMGEWGGSLEDDDRIIQEHLAKWMAERACIDDAFWWVFNPGKCVCWLLYSETFLSICCCACT